MHSSIKENKPNTTDAKIGRKMATPIIFKTTIKIEIRIKETPKTPYLFFGNNEIFIKRPLFI